MDHFTIDLPPQNTTGKFFKKTTNIHLEPEVHEWNKSISNIKGSPYVSTITGASKLDTKKLSSIQLKLYHCGGHNRYILLDDSTSTSKSFFILVFKVPDYKSYRESYHQLVGCHIESILCKNPNACIMLVGSYCDQIMQRNENGGLNNVFLKKGEQLFKCVEKHISSIIENTGIRPKLLACQETKIFYLSNTENIHTTGSNTLSSLYDGQEMLKVIWKSLLDNDRIIPIGTMPSFWDDFLQMVKNAGSEHHCITFEDAKKMYKKCLENLSNDGKIQNEFNVNSSLIRYLENRRFLVESHKKQNAEGPDDSLRLALKYFNEIGEALWFENTDLLKDTEKYIFTKISALTGTLDHLFDSDLINKWNAYNFRNLVHVSRSDKLDQGIVTKRTFEDLFEDSFLSFKREEWDTNTNENLNTLGMSSNNSLSNERYSLTADPQNGLGTIFIRLNVLEDLLLNLQIMLKIKTTEDDEDKDLYIIPSMIQNPVSNYTKDRSTDNVLHQFQDQLQYTFAFGKRNSFLSAGVTDAFLFRFILKLFANTQRDYPGQVPQALCYRDPIEFRVPGIVFAIEFFPGGTALQDQRGKITVLEEERLSELSNEVKCHKERLVHVFIDPGRNTLQDLSEIQKSMAEAIKMSVKNDKKISKVVDTCGLKCMKCIYPEGYIGGSFDQNIWTCSINEAHFINRNAVFQTNSHDPGRNLIIRRYASSVSI